MTARTVVLGRVRAALTSPATGRSVPTHPARRYRTRGEHEPGAPELVDLLGERVLDYRAVFLRATAASLPKVIAAALPTGRAAGEGTRPRIVVPIGLPPAWMASADVEVVEDEDALDPRSLDSLDGVVTACTVAIAETGTIVLDGSTGQGRRAITLLPDLHVCVIRADQVVASVPEALAVLDPRRPLTFISGPSATSDIELARVEGVHGPRRLIAVLVSGGLPGLA